MVGIALTSTGDGYRLVQSDGTTILFRGDISIGGKSQDPSGQPARPIVGVAAG
ncbi:MAG: hypothetical protein M5U14_18635 [Acidimicrobiia bacterium]|nr:hypothetical protein [Acidimicrobiia bacterium]